MGKKKSTKKSHTHTHTQDSRVYTSRGLGASISLLCNNDTIVHVSLLPPGHLTDTDFSEKVGSKNTDPGDSLRCLGNFFFSSQVAKSGEADPQFLKRQVHVRWWNINF